MKRLAYLSVVAPFGIACGPAWGAGSCQPNYGITIEESTESEFDQAMMSRSDEEGVLLYLKSQTFTAQGRPETDASWQQRKACHHEVVQKIVETVRRSSLRLIPQKDLDRLGIDPRKFVDPKKYVPFGMRDQITPVAMTFNVLFSDGPRPACTDPFGAVAIYIIAIEPAAENGRDWGELTVVGAGIAECAHTSGQIFVKYRMESAASAVRYYLEIK